MNELKLVRKLYSYLQDIMKINENTVDQLIDGKKDDASYIELGIIYIEDAGLNSTLATSALSNC